MDGEPGPRGDPRSAPLAFENPVRRLPLRPRLLWLALSLAVVAGLGLLAALSGLR